VNAGHVGASCVARLMSAGLVEVVRILARERSLVTSAEQRSSPAGVWSTFVRCGVKDGRRWVQLLLNVSWGLSLHTSLELPVGHLVPVRIGA
jgi:hypothetical protein